MVNCKNCGAPLSLNEAFCPHCGTPNPEAQEHLKKLRILDERFEDASREVAAEVKKSKKGYGILLILIMLLLANLVVFSMSSEMSPIFSIPILKSLSFQRNEPMEASPAPVVSTASTFGSSMTLISESRI